MTSRLHPLARLILAAIGLFAAQVAAGVVLGAIYIAVALARAPGQSLGNIIASLANANESNALVLALFVYPIGLLWLGFCRAKLDKRSFVSLGLRRSRFGPNLLRGMATGSLSIAVIWAILWVTGTISVRGWSDASRNPTAYLALLGWLVAFGAVGFFEEFVFRGYALHNLTDWLGWKWAVLIQATIFALIHLANVATASNAARMAALGAMPSIFLIGIFFALSYRKTGSLWFPIGFHAAWNFSLGCLFSLPVSGIKTFQLLNVQANADNWLSGGSFGAEGSFFLLPVLLALIWLILQAPDHPQALLDLELAKPTNVANAPVVTAPIETAGAETVEAEIAEEEAHRENRYRTKFGTSAGFDEEMLRELRALQRQREADESEKQRELTAQTATLDADLLKPIAAAPNVAIAPIQSAQNESETPQIEAAPPEKIEPKVHDTPPDNVTQIKVHNAPETQEKRVKVHDTAPDEIGEAKLHDAAATPVAAPIPVSPPKKARPKW